LPRLALSEDPTVVGPEIVGALVLVGADFPTGAPEADADATVSVRVGTRAKRTIVRERRRA
jgi:hypothetical protein